MFLRKQMGKKTAETPHNRLLLSKKRKNFCYTQMPLFSLIKKWKKSDPKCYTIWFHLYNTFNVTNYRKGEQTSGCYLSEISAGWGKDNVCVYKNVIWEILVMMKVFRISTVLIYISCYWYYTTFLKILPLEGTVHRVHRICRRLYSVLHMHVNLQLNIMHTDQVEFFPRNAMFIIWKVFSVIHYV